jgi:hypothetical protein
LGCPNVSGVDFGARADRTDASDAAARYANKRAQMWGFMKEWLKVGSLPDDNELAADLKAVDYGYDASDAILLERKDDMRRRGLASPDDGDALALTFAYPVAKRDWAKERRASDFFKMTKAFPTSTLNSEPDRDDEVFKRFHRVHYWPKCEVPTASGNVRCSGQSGRDGQEVKTTRLTQS